RRRHTSFSRDWSSDVCSSDLATGTQNALVQAVQFGPVFRALQSLDGRCRLIINQPGLHLLVLFEKQRLIYHEIPDHWHTRQWPNLQQGLFAEYIGHTGDAAEPVSTRDVRPVRTAHASPA